MTTIFLVVLFSRSIFGFCDVDDDEYAAKCCTGGDDDSSDVPLQACVNFECNDIDLFLPDATNLVRQNGIYLNNSVFVGYNANVVGNIQIFFSVELWKPLARTQFASGIALKNGDNFSLPDKLDWDPSSACKRRDVAHFFELRSTIFID
jgi:hypothetical protein